VSKKLRDYSEKFIHCNNYIVKWSRKEFRMKAVLRKTEAQEPFIFRIVGSDEAIILKSENYKAKKSAENGIASVLKNRLEAKRYELKTAKNGKFFFNIKATNGQVVATSAFYDSEVEREMMIKILQDENLSITTEDQTT
jgi:uncharacterized protein YegP (UPF0339 family)